MNSKKQKLHFDTNETNLIYQYAPSGDVLKSLQEIFPYLKEPSVKKIVGRTIQKLEMVPKKKRENLVAKIFEEKKRI